MIHNPITMALSLLLFALPTHSQEQHPLSVSIELLRDYSITHNEQPIENTIAIEKAIGPFSLGLENIFYTTASADASASDEVNLTVGYGLNDVLSAALLSRAIIINQGTLDSEFFSGIITTFSFNLGFTLEDENELIIGHKEKQLEYINTLLLEYEMTSSNSLSTSIGFENELLLVQKTDPANVTLFFYGVQYSTFGVTLGYALESRPEISHALSLGLTFEL